MKSWTYVRFFFAVVVAFHLGTSHGKLSEETHLEDWEFFPPGRSDAIAEDGAIKPQRTNSKVQADEKGEYGDGAVREYRQVEVRGSSSALGSFHNFLSKSSASASTSGSTQGFCVTIKRTIDRVTNKVTITKGPPVDCSTACITMRVAHGVPLNRVGDGPGSYLSTCDTYQTANKKAKGLTCKSLAGSCRSFDFTDYYCIPTVKAGKTQKNLGAIPTDMLCPGAGKRKGWKKKITLKMSFKKLNAFQYKGNLKRQYELAYGIGIKIYDTTERAYLEGCGVMSKVLPSALPDAAVKEDHIQEKASSTTAMVSTEDLIQEKASSTTAAMAVIEFEAVIDTTDAERAAEAITARQFKDSVEKANIVTGKPAPVPSAADTKVGRPSVVDVKSSAESNHPKLLASMLFLFTGIIYNAC